MAPIEWLCFCCKHCWQSTSALRLLPSASAARGHSSSKLWMPCRAGYSPGPYMVVCCWCCFCCCYCRLSVPVGKLQLNEELLTVLCSITCHFFFSALASASAAVPCYAHVCWVEKPTTKACAKFCCEFIDWESSNFVVVGMHVSLYYKIAEKGSKWNMFRRWG